MSTLVQDANLAESLVEDRRRKGLDRHDEVWEGMYVVMPFPDVEHQRLASGIGRHLGGPVEDELGGQVFVGVNVSDRVTGWTKNFRCPDVAIYLPGNPARQYRTHWLGGPDTGIEIVSPNDRSRDKLGFYAAVNTRELLIVDRDPWALEMYRRQRGKMKLIGRGTRSSARPLESDVLPLSWRLVPGEPRPRIEITHTDGRRWVV
jgi:Uma2 family endonuclease